VNDLITRLRDYANPLMQEAADSLERLTSGKVAFCIPLFDDKHNLSWSDSEIAAIEDYLENYGDMRAAAAVLAEREACIDTVWRLHNEGPEAIDAALGKLA